MPGRMSLQPILSPSARTATDALATSPWAPLAAVGGQHQVLLYHTDTLELVGVLPFPEGTPRVLKFSRNGALLLAGGGVGGASGRVVVWNVRSGERIIEVGDELDEVLAADISSDQTLIALGGPQRVVRIYSTDTGQLMHEIRKHTDWVTTLEFSPDSVLLATGDRNGGLFVWEGWTGREYLTLNGHTASVTSVSWRSDSNIVASSSEDGTIRLWEMENGGQVKNWGAHGGGATCVEFTRDGRLFSCGRDHVAKLWDQNGGQQLAYEAFGDLALRATFCDETGRAISGDWNGEIRVWNAADGVRLGELVMNPPTIQTRLDAANQRLASVQQSHPPIAESHQVAQAALETMRTMIAAATASLSRVKAKGGCRRDFAHQHQQTAAQAVAERNALQQIVDELGGTVPVLREAAEKATAASARLPADENLLAAMRTIVATTDAKASELESSRQSLAQKTQLAETAAMEIATLEKAVQETAAQLASAQKSEQDLLAQLPAIEGTAASSQQAFDQSMAELTAAKQAVDRWTDELAFSKLLDDLLSQRTQSASVLAEQEGKLAELQDTASVADLALRQGQEAVTASQSALAAAEKDYQAAIVAVGVAKQAQQDANTAKDEVVAATSRIEQVIAALTEATQKMEQAKSLEKDDTSLDDAIASLKNVTMAKTSLLETTQADLIVKSKAIEDAVANEKSAEQNVASLLALQDSIKQQVARQIADVPNLEAASRAAQLAIESFSSEVDKAREQFESIQASIAAAKGLNP